MPNRYKGENHVPLIVNGKIIRGEYTGPKTWILERAKLNIKPLTVVDIVSAIHDCDYWLAQLAPTKEEQLKRVRLADKEMLGRLELTKEFKLDNFLNIKAGKIGIGTKVKIEKKGKILGSLVGLATAGPLGAVAGYLAGKKGKNKLEAIAGPLVQHPEKDIQFIRRFRQSKVDEFNKLVGISGQGIDKIKGNGARQYKESCVKNGNVKTLNGNNYRGSGYVLR